MSHKTIDLSYSMSTHHNPWSLHVILRYSLPVLQSIWRLFRNVGNTVCLCWNPSRINRNTFTHQPTMSITALMMRHHILKYNIRNGNISLEWLRQVESLKESWMVTWIYNQWALIRITPKETSRARQIIPLYVRMYRYMSKCCPLLVKLCCCSD